MANLFGTQATGALGEEIEEVAASIDVGKLRITISTSGTEANLSMVFINYQGDVNGVEIQSAIILIATINFIPVTPDEAPDDYEEYNDIVEVKIKPEWVPAMIVIGVLMVVVAPEAAASTAAASGVLLIINAWKKLNESDET
ncbi:MAG: hypothetical protein LBT80_07580 [Lactobacillaceae bacterium]|nr:hypothetical protein [Lactobacillaceae bacterium]